MKVLEAQFVQLGNAEVLAHLDRLSGRTSQPSTSAAPRPAPRPMKSPNFETVVKELTEYLAPSSDRTAAAAAAATGAPEHPLPPYGSAHYAPARVRALLRRLARFRLTQAERLMVVNLRPTTAIALDVVLEECDDRFRAEEQDEMLRIIAEELGGGEAQEGGGEGGIEGVQARDEPATNGAEDRGG